jgi:hypothetical protein
MLAAASGLAACSGPPDQPPPPGKATLDIKVSGLTGASSGGTVSGQKTSDPSYKLALNLPNPTGDIAEGNLPGVDPASYDITYSPPGLYQVVQGTVTVVVAADEIKQVPFTCQFIVVNGAVHVVTTGLTGASSGGTVSARKIDNTGVTFGLNMPLPVAGTSSGDLSGMPPASYNVIYSPPPGFQLVNAGSSPVVVAVTAGNIGAANFACQAIVIPGGVVFVSDWSTATGATAAALQDTGKTTPWNTLVNSNNLLNVVSASGLGFPAGMTNVLEVTHRVGGQASAHVAASSLWALPALNQSLFFRVYLRNAIANAEGNLDLNSHHPMEVGTGGFSTEDWEWTYGSQNDGTFPIKFACLNPLTNAHKTRWCLGAGGTTTNRLNKNATYRLEWKLTKTATNTYTLDIRIYDSSGTLVWHSGNIFGAQTGDPALSASGGGIVMTDAVLGTMQLGTNGGSWNLGVVQHSYWGGLMVRSDNWCGPYPP